jgi:hypothetical protein
MMAGNLIQAEQHLRSDYCPHCLEKHLLGSEMYMSEQASTNPNSPNRDELLALADRVREIRRRIQELNNMKHTTDQQKLQSTV